MISEREKMNMLTVIFMVFIAGVFFLFLRAEMCKVKGRKPEKNVMLMSHHDVVPAEGKWSYPPFSGQIAEGCI